VRLWLGFLRLRSDLPHIAEEVGTLRNRDRESLVRRLFLVALLGEVVTCFLGHRCSSLRVMALDLSGSWAKVRRAKEHANALEAAVSNPSKFYRPEDWGADAQFQRKARYFSVRLTGPDITLPLRWSVWIGDILHNMRSALDHLAWQLVQDGRCPNPKMRELVQFPIYSDRTSYNKMLDKRLPGVSRAALKIIRTRQPYLRGKRAADHPLALLAAFSNADKHRLVLPILHRSTDVSDLHVVPGSVRECEVHRIEQFGPEFALQPGKEIARVHVTRIAEGVEPDMKIYVKGRAAIALDGGPDLGGTIGLIGNYLEAILLEFGPEPDDPGQG